MTTMPSMPKMPRARRERPIRECACGCKGPTKGTWMPGHDGRAMGWAIRAERGMPISDIPPNERKGAAIMMKRRGTWDAAIAKIREAA